MSPDTKKLYRSRSNRMIFGVCGGLGGFFGIDPSLMRLLFVIGTLFGFGSFIFIYLAIFIIVPEEPVG
jgi:phage shock protein C